jgi:hypothetical protein
VHQRVCQLVEHGGLTAARAPGDTERVIPVFHQVQHGSRLQSPAHRGEQVQPGELITGTLEEKHREIHVVEVLCPAGAGLAWRVEGKS